MVEEPRNCPEIRRLMLCNMKNSHKEWRKKMLLSALRGDCSVEDLDFNFIAKLAINIVCRAMMSKTRKQLK